MLENNTDTIFEQDEPAKLKQIFRDLWYFGGSLLEHYKLLIVLFLVVVSVALASTLVTQPVYEATAIIGPPSPSPVSALISASGASTSATSIGRRLFGGSAPSNDPFQEYQQMIRSPRLNQALVDHDHLLQKIFYKRWDADKQAWRAPGPAFAIKAAIGRAFSRPVSSHPDVESMRNFLGQNFSIAPIDNDSGMAGLSSSTGYFVARVKAERPEMAQSLLRSILQRTDELIRADELYNVEARINFLNKQLQSMALTEQKDVLINLLSNQMSIKVMLVADKQYSYVLVSPPYSSSEPVTPSGPAKLFVFAFFIAVILWCILVALASRMQGVNRMVRVFGR